MAGNRSSAAPAAPLSDRPSPAVGTATTVRSAWFPGMSTSDVRATVPASAGR